MMKKTVLLLILLSGLSLFAQKLDVQGSNKHYKNATEFLKQKNYPQCIEELVAANKLRPNYPRYIYALARVYSLAGETAKAMDLLGRLASFKIHFDIENDSSFVPLFKLDQFTGLKYKFISNLSPVVKSEVAFSLKEKDLLTEGIAYNPVTGRFYISSVHKGKIIELNSSGVWRDFVKEGEHDLWANFGLTVDVKRQILWACSGAIEQTRHVDTSSIGKSGLIAYNLKNGKLIKKFLITGARTEHLLGDLTLNSNGDLYTTDTKAKIIYRLVRGKNKIEEFYKSKDFVSLQGLAFSGDGKFLYVADYSTGLHRIDLKTKEKIVVSYPYDLMILGIDGLSIYKNSLIAIQNGANPHRVLKLDLNDNGTGISAWKVLESNNPLFDEPTLGFIWGDDFFFIANSQWENFNKKGEVNSPDKLKEPVILKLSLEKN